MNSDHITGSLMQTYRNTPLTPDDLLRLAATKPKRADVEAPREITITGNNVPACSRPYMNRAIDPETARTITRGRVRPRSSPLPDQQHERHEMTDETEKPTYREAVAELRRKYGYPPEKPTYREAVAELRREFGYAPEPDETDNR